MITASIVLYNTDLNMLMNVITSYSPREGRYLYLIDNSPVENSHYRELSSEFIFYYFMGTNNGYGAGHNVALREAIRINSKYHIVLNPDLQFKSSVIDALCLFADQNISVGQIMPKILSPQGNIQYLCKLLPTPIDLIFKRFLPKKISKKITYRFQLMFADYDRIMDIPYLSGCFMFFRVEALKDIGLFDERFFMYPEDIDITRRMHEKYRTVYFPQVSIIHAHAASSYHDKKMLKIHVLNMIKYFNKWGWVFDSKRRKINKTILQKLNYKNRGHK